MTKKTASYQEAGKKIASYAKESQQLMGAFTTMHHIGSQDGALLAKYKELIALGIAIHTQCEGCILMHVQDAIEAGATHEEIVETIDTAVYMGGGPSVIYGSKAFAVLQEYEKLNAE